MRWEVTQSETYVKDYDWEVTYVDDSGFGGKLLCKQRTDTIKTMMWWEVTYIDDQGVVGSNLVSNLRR